MQKIICAVLSGTLGTTAALFAIDWFWDWLISLPAHVLLMLFAGFVGLLILRICDDLATIFVKLTD